MGAEKGEKTMNYTLVWFKGCCIGSLKIKPRSLVYYSEDRMQINFWVEDTLISMYGDAVSYMVVI